MARPNTLVPGNCYFLVGYYDNDLLYPLVSTLRYVRCEDDGERGRTWLFEEPQSSADQEEQDQQSLVAFDEDQLYQILEFPGLLAALSEVAADHPLRATDRSPSSPMTPDGDFGDLAQQVAKFLDDLEYLSVTVTIRFTDDALSLGRRRDSGFEMSFFPHPRIQPDKEARIRAVFASIGVKPHVDYLADNGRTRILGFAIPEEHGAIVKLCERVFIDVHGMRTDDSLRYSFLSRSDIK